MHDLHPRLRRCETIGDLERREHRLKVSVDPSEFEHRGDALPGPRPHLLDDGALDQLPLKPEPLADLFEIEALFKPGRDEHLNLAGRRDRG